MYFSDKEIVGIATCRHCRCETVITYKPATVVRAVREYTYECSICKHESIFRDIYFPEHYCN